jgi:hypothetical protein
VAVPPIVSEPSINRYLLYTIGGLSSGQYYTLLQAYRGVNSQEHVLRTSGILVVVWCLFLILYIFTDYLKNAGPMI